MPRKNKEESPTLHMRLLRRILPMALATVALLPLLLIPLFVLWPAASSLFPNFIKGRLHLFATKENWGFQSLLLSKPHVYFRNKGHSDQSSSSHGVSFQRTIENFPTNSTFQLFFDKEKCQDEDSFGNSHCHYDWGGHVTADYSIFVNETLTESAFVEGTFKVDAKIPWSFTCPLCGQDCVLKVPVIDLEHTIPMPPCPITPRNRSHAQNYNLWRDSPTHGWISIPFEGTASIYSSADNLLAKVSIMVTVR